MKTFESLYSDLYDTVVTDRTDNYKVYKDKIEKLEKRVKDAESVLNSYIEENKQLKERNRELNKQLFNMICNGEENDK